MIFVVKTSFIGITLTGVAAVQVVDWSSTGCWNVLQQQTKGSKTGAGGHQVCSGPVLNETDDQCLEFTMLHSKSLFIRSLTTKMSRLETSDNNKDHNSRRHLHEIQLPFGVVLIQFNIQFATNQKTCFILVYWMLLFSWNHSSYLFHLLIEQVWPPRTLKQDLDSQAGLCQSAPTCQALWSAEGTTAPLESSAGAFLW